MSAAVVPPISTERTRAILSRAVAEFVETTKWIQKMPKHPPPPPPIPIPGKSSNRAGGGDVPGEKDSRDNVTPPSFPEFSPTTFAAMDAFAIPTPPIPKRRPSLPILSFSESLTTTNSATNRRSVVPIRTSPGLGSEEEYRYPEMGGGSSKANNPHEDLVKKAFKPLEDYLTTAFTSCDCLNASFVKRRSGSGSDSSESKSPDNKSPLPQTFKPQSQTPGAPRGTNEGRKRDIVPVTDKIGEKEAILLQRGRFLGKEIIPSRSEKERHRAKSESRLGVRNPGIDWESVDEFYDMVINVCLGFESGKPESSNKKAAARSGKIPSGGQSGMQTIAVVEEIRDHIAGILLKATENLLKRPGRPLKKPEDVRFLLIVLANPLLYPESARPASRQAHGMYSPNRERLVIPTSQLKN